jgi:hypothetical protein
MHIQEFIVNPIPLCVAIDGVHLTDSSGIQFCSIVGYLPLIKDSSLFPSGFTMLILKLIPPTRINYIYI